MADHEDKHGNEAHADGAHGGGGHKSHGPPHGAAHEEGEAGAPEWLISFADNVTLMMAFFAILLAMNMKEPTTGGVGGKESNPSASSPAALDLSIAIRSAFNNPVNSNSTNPYEQALVRRLRERGQGGNATEEGPSGDFERVQSQQPSDYYTPSGVVNFAMGSAELSAAAHDQAQQIAAEIRDLTYVIEIRGHASPFEVFRNEREGFRFSFERAAAVFDALTAAGVPADNLRVVACSDGIPLGDRARTRAEGEQLQIVEVITTGESLKPRAGMTPGAPPPAHTGGH
jgi:flagellar motor protein MotB